MTWISVLIFLLGFPSVTPAFPISSAAWSNSAWRDHCKDVRTSYNPKHALATDRPHPHLRRSSVQRFSLLGVGQQNS